MNFDLVMKYSFPYFANRIEIHQQITPNTDGNFLFSLKKRKEKLTDYLLSHNPSAFSFIEYEEGNFEEALKTIGLYHSEFLGPEPPYNPPALTLALTWRMKLQISWDIQMQKQELQQYMMQVDLQRT